MTTHGWPIMTLLFNSFDAGTIFKLLSWLFGGALAILDKLFVNKL